MKLPKNIKTKILELREKHVGVPVPVIAIARELKIKIYETYDFDNTQSGSIKKEDGKYVIYLNTSDSAERKRFTIAHELGHFLMHNEYLNQGNESVTESKQHYPSLNRTATSEDIV